MSTGNTANGGVWNDEVSTFWGNDGGDAYTVPNANNWWLYGNNGEDTLNGAGGADTLWGYAGDDLLAGGAGADVLVGGAGADTMRYLTGYGADTVAADATPSQMASDVINFYNISVFDLNFSVAGEQLIIAVGAATGATDTLTLENWASYNNSSLPATANLSRINRFVTSDIIFGVAIADVGVASTLLGTSLPDLVFGSSLDDSLNGAGGPDLFSAGDGDDTMFFDGSAYLVSGGQGTDAVVVADGGVLVNLGDTARFSSVEQVVGGAGADSLAGSALAETVSGNSGADMLWGAGGDDSMSGGTATDTYWFGSGCGIDTVADEGVDNASDQVLFYDVAFHSLAFSAVGDDLTVDLAAAGVGLGTLVLENWEGYNAAGAAGMKSRIERFVTMDATFGLAVGNDSSASLLGTSLNDYVQAGAGDDTVDGKGGGDYIMTGGGDDVIFAYAGDLLVNGGAGTDTLVVMGNTAGQLVNLGLTAQYSSVEYVAGGTGHDSLAGSNVSDYIETLAGGEGNDILWGSGGADSLSGGAGADTYWFGVGDGNDTVAASTDNSQDLVKFFGLSAGEQIAGAQLSGEDLTVTLVAGNSLTLLDWGKSDGSKLNQFSFAGGIYALTMTDDTTASWSKIS